MNIQVKKERETQTGKTDAHPNYDPFQTVVLGTNRKENNYYVYSSTKGIFFQLFIHETRRDGLPETKEGWMNVSYKFLPDTKNASPTECRLIFNNHHCVCIQAKLPKTDADAVALIDKNYNFVVSNKKVFTINKYYLGKY